MPRTPREGKKILCFNYLSEHKVPVHVLEEVHLKNLPRRYAPFFRPNFLPPKENHLKLKHAHLPLLVNYVNLKFPFRKYLLLFFIYFSNNLLGCKMCLFAAFFQQAKPSAR